MNTVFSGDFANVGACDVDRRYYYGSAGYPDAMPFPAHIVAANADDLGVWFTLLCFLSRYYSFDLLPMMFMQIC